ncbi:hypothetical protein ACQJBY_057415 [Aegilops geniculata]
MDKKAAGTGEDPFCLLPDDLLDHILSFLPADDAMQTCVLGTRWRDIWRRKTRLRFTSDDWSSYSYERFKQLVKLIIHLRGVSPLTHCKIENPGIGGTGTGTPGSETYYDSFTATKLLIDYALKCQAEDLAVSAADYDDLPLLLDAHLISRHLRVIEFIRVDFVDYSVYFSGCLVLEELRMEHCSTYAHRICSESLKRLSFIKHYSFPEDFHIYIDAPSLISLELDEFEGLTPWFGEMPLLETAFVILEGSCHRDSCESNHEDFNDPSCECRDNECVLLDKLSNAVDLVLAAEPGVFIYRWDLEWCPVFGKLKTLTLNNWFMAIDLDCILQHSPVLEMLTLRIDIIKSFVGATGSQETIEQPSVCARRLAVTIECHEVDQGVHEILNMLSACGILREQICFSDMWPW